MKALVYEGPAEISYSEVEDPDLPGPDGAIVRSRLCGICGSDLHVYHGHGFSRHPRHTIGHETMGEVVAVGPDVRSFAIGDRVLVSAIAGCGHCVPCRRGHTNACERERGRVYGVGWGLPGCQAELVPVKHADFNIFHLPEEISDESATLLTDSGPTGWYGARLADVSPGATVVVIGLGPVGLMATMSALLMGAARVVAADPVAARRDRAETLGAQAVAPDELVDVVASHTGGRGAHAVIEAVGAASTIRQAIEVVRVSGNIAVVGVNLEGAMPFPMDLAFPKEVQFRTGVTSVHRELPALLELAASGRFVPDVIVTHRMPLADGAAAYELFDARADDVCKVVLDPTLT
jgi:alcohol dehydrogenase